MVSDSASRVAEPSTPSAVLPSLGTMVDPRFWIWAESSAPTSNRPIRRVRSRSISGLLSRPWIISGPWVARSEMIDATGPTMIRMPERMTSADARPSGMYLVSQRYTGTKMTYSTIAPMRPLVKGHRATASATPSTRISPAARSFSASKNDMGMEHTRIRPRPPAKPVVLGLNTLPTKVV